MVVSWRRGRTSSGSGLMVMSWRRRLVVLVLGRFAGCWRSGRCRVRVIVLIFVRRMNMLSLLSHLHIRPGLHADKDISPHTALCVPADRAKIFVSTGAGRFHDQFLGLNGLAVAGDQLCTAGGVRYFRSHRKVAHNVTEPNVVPHVDVNVHEENT